MAIRDGRLCVPEECESCGSSGPARIEAHHHQGYDEAHWLDVIWLCHSCHMRADGIINSEACKDHDQGEQS
jgi:hypothetical protein